MTTVDTLRKRVHRHLAPLTAGGDMCCDMSNVVWLSDDVGLVIECGKIVALIIPIADRAKIDRFDDGKDGHGHGDQIVPEYNRQPVNQTPVLPLEAFDESFEGLFDGVMASLYPNLRQAYLRARVHAP